MQSKATSVEAYLKELPEDRRAAIAAVREVILKNLDPTYEEGMSYGMIGYYVPHSVYPAGYHCDPSKPLPFAGLGSQKNHMSLYLMCVYGDTGEHAKLVEGFKKAGKKLDMGKACVRFKSLDDLPLDVIGAAVKRVPAKTYIEKIEALLESMGRGRNRKPQAQESRDKKASAKKPAAKRARTPVKKAAAANRGAKKKAKKGM
ncbi:MAG: DUF1801 domain-containing protein [Phycisphaerales bacterium]